MKLRTHTVPLPTDYVSQLRNQGKRKKSRCFIEYFYDIVSGSYKATQVIESAVKEFRGQRASRISEAAKIAAFRKFMKNLWR